MPHLDANFKDEQAECKSKNEEARGIYVLALEDPENWSNERCTKGMGVANCRQATHQSNRSSSGA